MPRAANPKHGLIMAGGVDREPRMGDGCLHAFLDVGANRGVHLRYLMEPSTFAGAPYLQWGFFDAYFGRYQNDPRVCAFGFEPNPAHAARLERLARHWRAARRVVEVLPAAVSGGAAATTLMHRQHGDGRNSDWDFGRRALTGQQSTSVRVPTVRLSAFVRHELLARTLPPPRDGDRPPAILMKLDVEGSELEVLDDLRVQGVLCNLSLITVEFHPRLWRAPYSAGYRAFPELFRFVSRHTEEPSKPGDMRELIPRAADRTFAPHCGVRFVQRDDEHGDASDLPARPWEPGLAAWAAASRAGPAGSARSTQRRGNGTRQT